MPLASLSDLLAEARREAYAVPYAESWNLESLEAVIDAAEESHSPIIAGFNGGFLRHPTRKKPENLAYYACFRKALDLAKVPVAFILNESDDLGQIRAAIEMGFNAVMPENEGLEVEEYRELVKAVVRIAKPRGVWVEAQIGLLPAGHADHNGSGSMTDPDLAAQFVEDTGIDALAISIGNVHILTEGKATVDLEAVRRIREKISVPLVVHGGTSLTAESLRAMVALGVAKVNFGTVLKQAYLEAVRESLSKYHPPLSPHEFLGKGGSQDIMIAGREAVKREVLRLIEVCGAKGRVQHDFVPAI
jgi:ketose-bisphosphate aldolase